MELIDIYPGVDFKNPGYTNYISIRIAGCLLNYVYKNVPSISIKNSDDFAMAGDEGTGKRQGQGQGKERGQGQGKGQGKRQGKRQREFIRSVLFDEIQDTCDDMEGEPEIELELFRYKVFMAITEFMETLSPFERFIFVARFVDEKPLIEIGKCVNLLRDATSRRIESIVKRLKDFLNKRYSWHLDTEDIISYLKERGSGWVIRAETEAQRYKAP